MTVDNLPSLGALKPSQLVAEYDQKAAALESVLATFEGAGSALKMAATIGGTWGNANIDVGHVSLSTLKRSLLSSAWAHIYGAMQIERLASPNEKRKFQQSLADPAPFTLDNIRATFGVYVANPRAAILRGMAEVFCGLDPAYKSHDKVKIGVEGLPKRIILPGVGGFGSYGKDRLERATLHFPYHPTKGGGAANPDLHCLRPPQFLTTVLRMLHTWYGRPVRCPPLHRTEGLPPLTQRQASLHTPVPSKLGSVIPSILSS